MLALEEEAQARDNGRGKSSRNSRNNSSRDGEKEHRRSGPIGIGSLGGSMSALDPGHANYFGRQARAMRSWVTFCTLVYLGGVSTLGSTMVDDDCA